MTDPIADFLTQVRNAIGARKDTVTLPSSKTKRRIAEIFKERGFIQQVVEEDQKPQAILKLFLRYDGDKQSRIRHIQRVSRPGRRVYRGYKEIHSSLRGLGLKVLSTPIGVISDREARQKKVGGEILCEIW